MARLLQNKCGLQARLLQNKCGLQSFSTVLFVNKAHVSLCSNICNKTRYPKLLSKVDSQNISQRKFTSLFKKPTLEELQLSDKVPPQFTLIYNNRMKNYLLYGHLTVFFCVVTFVIICLIKSGSLSFKRDSTERNKSTRLRNDQLIFFTALIVFVVVLQSLILRMPIRIYNNPETNRYAFIYYGLTPNSTKTLFCHLNEIVKQDEKGLLPWKDSRFVIREKENAILIHNFFRTPSDLNIILGHQKPPNDQ